MHIEYAYKKLYKCVGILYKPRKSYINLLSSATIIILHTLISYIAIMFWENNPFCLERSYLKNNIRIITGLPFRAQIEPLFLGNKILNVYDINNYIIGTFRYEPLYGNIPQIIVNYFSRNAGVHDHNLWNANDLYVIYGRFDIWKICTNIAGANF